MSSSQLRDRCLIGIWNWTSTIVFIGNLFLRWGFLIWVLILLRTFVLNLVVFGCFFSIHFVQRVTLSKTWCDRQQLWKAVITGLQESAFLSEVAVNHPKMARGDTWPKRCETNKKKLPRWGRKSAIKLILWPSTKTVVFNPDFALKHVFSHLVYKICRLRRLSRTPCKYTYLRWIPTAETEASRRRYWPLCERKWNKENIVS